MSKFTGKGSGQRPAAIAKEEYRSNWDSIFGKKKEEPKDHVDLVEGESCRFVCFLNDPERESYIGRITEVLQDAFIFTTPHGSHAKMDLAKAKTHLIPLTLIELELINVYDTDAAKQRAEKVMGSNIKMTEQAGADVAVAYASLLFREATVAVKPSVPQLLLDTKHPPAPKVKPNYFMWTSEHKKFIDLVEFMLSQYSNCTSTDVTPEMVTGKVIHSVAGESHYVIAKFPLGTGIERTSTIDSHADIYTTLHAVGTNWKALIDNKPSTKEE